MMNSSKSTDDEAKPTPITTYTDKGRKLIDWMDGKNLGSCPIKRSTLTYNDMAFNYSHDDTVELLPEDLQKSSFNIGCKLQDKNFHLLRVRPNPRSLSSWEGIVTSDAIILLSVTRDRGPYISEISNAIYRHFYPTSQLKHVVVKSIVNYNTLEFLERYLFEGNDVGLDEWTWNYGSKEYEGLIGTEIGAMVASLVIGALEPSKYRISKIMTQVDKESRDMRFTDMRFDIEPITNE